MATVNTTAVFPSTRYITTDATGELGEVVSAAETKASIEHDGFKLTAVAGGVLAAGDLPSLEVVEDLAASGIAFEVAGKAITIRAQSTAGSAATFDELTSDGVTYKAETAGDSGITVTIRESQASDAINLSGSAITIDLDDVMANKTQADILNLYGTAGASIKDLIDITITDPAGALASTLTNQDLIGGNNEVPATGIEAFTHSQLATAYSSFVGSDLSDLVTLEEGSGNLSSTLGQTNFANGTAEVTSDLDPDSEYIVIKRTDLHDLDSTSAEKDDARKFLWGIIHKASEVFAGLGDPPENFTISKGNPASVDNGTALEQTYTVNAKYGISNLDLKSES